jgi:hypothetical protein
LNNKNKWLEPTKDESQPKRQYNKNKPKNLKDLEDSNIQKEN